MGSVGEALFFASLFVLGSLALVVLLTSLKMHSWPASEYFPEANYRGTMWLVLLVLVSFVLIGGGGVLYTVVQVGTSAERRAALAKSAASIDLVREAALSPQDYPNVPRVADLTNSPGVTLAYRLPIARSAAWRLFAATTFCLVWNSIALVFIVVAAGSHISGPPDWFLTSVTVPFVVTGLWSIYYLVRLWTITTGIGPTSIEISDHPLYPGHSYEILLSQSGRLSVTSLDVLLVCEEEAMYRQGTDVRTDCRRVHQERIFHQEGIEVKPGMPMERKCLLDIPRNVMHSFQSEHNSVHWTLEVQGDVAGWPTYHRSFPVVVYPDTDGKEDA